MTNRTAYILTVKWDKGTPRDVPRTLIITVRIAKGETEDDVMVKVSNEVSNYYGYAHKGMTFRNVQSINIR